LIGNDERTNRDPDRNSGSAENRALERPSQGVLHDADHKGASDLEQHPGIQQHLRSEQFQPLQTCQSD
jgi:hypothetical protein